ncbi:MAG: CCA tRNA nucleotidyltransferase [Acholeplasmataceae bacterium]
MKKAILLLKEFEKLGYQAYIVGGSVRDYILKSDSFDIDIATDATPDEVMQHFKSLPTGIRYGTVTVFFKGSKYEVTTFRKDFVYRDNRRPDKVIFSNNIKDDVKRRDFTVNGMYLDKDMKVIDLIGGQKDLEKKIVKTIGKPDDRFNEDALRMLRAFYLVSKLNFEIDHATLESIKRKKELITKVSAERIYNEIEKISNHPYSHKALILMIQTGIHQYLPGLTKGIVTLATYKINLKGDDFFIGAFFFNDQKIDKFWKLSNKKKKLYNNVLSILNTNEKISNELFYQYTFEELKTAGRIGEEFNLAGYSEKRFIELYESLPIKDDKELKITNKKIISLVNRKPGHWLTELRNDMIKEILNNRLSNNEEEIYKYIKRRKDIHEKK